MSSDRGGGCDGLLQPTREPQLDRRLLIWAFFRPMANLLIAAAALAVNYYGMKISFASMGLDFYAFLSSSWFIGGLFLAWAFLAFKSSAVDALLNLIDDLLGYNFALALLMSPYLAFLFWTTNGWRFLAFWLVTIAWLSVDFVLSIAA